jgi:hypothetical protein
VSVFDKTILKQNQIGSPAKPFPLPPNAAKKIYIPPETGNFVDGRHWIRTGDTGLYGHCAKKMVRINLA